MRKRDVQENVAVRRAQVFRCTWTEEEDLAYRAFVGNSASLGWLRESMTLGQIQKARRAASSIQAVLLHGRAVFTRSDDEATEITDILPSEIDAKEADETREFVRVGLPPRDSKFDKLHELSSWPSGLSVL